MDHEYGMGEEHLETQDYISSDVEYVETDADKEVYVPEPEVSDGTDFDVARTYPAEPAVPYEEPMSQHQKQHMEDIEKQYAPTRAVGVSQDVINLAQEFSSNSSEQAKAEALAQFSKHQLARFTSPKVIGPLLLMYAYRGKLSGLERVIWGAVGLGAAINAYGLMKPNKGFNHPLMKDVKGRIVG